VAGEDYTINVCHSGNTTTDIDDGEKACTDSEDVVSIYISTASTSAGGGEDGANAFAPPTSSSDSENGLNLGEALTKSGAATGVFIVNGDGQVEDNGTECDHGPPTFTFGIQ
jgi:hypothetical protein